MDMRAKIINPRGTLAPFLVYEFVDYKVFGSHASAVDKGSLCV